jgi:type III pantothenate kinase
MILLIDMGNSRIKWALWDGAQLFEQMACPYQDELVGVCLGKLLRHRAIDDIHISSVAKKDIEQDLLRRLQDVYKCDVSFAHSRRQMLGLINGYTNPLSLGVDRWLTMLAAYQQGHVSSCVVDCGSAMTIDLVREDGRHLGGMIMPGLTMQLDSMQRSLARLGNTSQTENKMAWGRDTASGMMAGGMLSLVGAIEYAMDYAQRELGAYPRLILTGGDAPRIYPYLSHDYEYHEYLVLEGLALVAGYDNRDK